MRNKFQGGRDASRKMENHVNKCLKASFGVFFVLVEFRSVRAENFRREARICKYELF